MKKILILAIAICIGFFMASYSAKADTSQSADEILQNILESEGVRSASELDCDAVLGTKWEELGEAFMDERHPEEDEHNFMDEMMGGEGSEGLEFMHINMGRAYAGCSFQDVESYVNYGPRGMMGYSDKQIATKNDDEFSCCFSDSNNQFSAFNQIPFTFWWIVIIGFVSVANIALFIGAILMFASAKNKKK